MSDQTIEKQNHFFWFLQTHLKQSEKNKFPLDFFSNPKHPDFECFLKKSLEIALFSLDRSLELQKKWSLFLNTAQENDILSLPKFQTLFYKPWSNKLPWAFQFLGNPACLKRPIVGIVGSRHPTYSGRENAFLFTKELAKHSCTIVSGGAIGIDAIANQTAIEHGTSSVAIIGSGLARLYPSSNAALFEKLNSPLGLILSEFSNSEPAHRWHFTQRNLSIASFCDFLLVIEVAENSGTLITARFALKQGIPVGVLCEHPYIPNNSAAQELISKGAFSIQKSWDILDRIKHFL